MKIQVKIPESHKIEEILDINEDCLKGLNDEERYEQLREITREWAANRIGYWFKEVN